MLGEDHTDIRRESKTLEDAKDNRWSPRRPKCDLLLGRQLII